MIVLNEGSKRSYEVGKQVAETERYRLYLCRPSGETADHLLQVASKVEHNGALDRDAYILERLLREAQRLEEEYAGVKTKSNHLLNYQLSFPALVDTFVPADQGHRRVNILRFREVDDVRKLVPLHNLAHRDRLRVDLRTSVWIMGKLLKTLTFTEAARTIVGNLTLGNILIEPDQHYVVIFDWADAQLTNGHIPRSMVCDEIRSAARGVIEVLGGTMEEGIPDDGSAEHARYEKHLVQLAQSGESDAFTAHQSFYTLVDSLWPRGFHQFTMLPRR